MIRTTQAGLLKLAALALAVAGVLPAAQASTVTGGSSVLTFSDTAINTLSLISVGVSASGAGAVTRNQFAPGNGPGAVPQKRKKTHQLRTAGGADYP